MFDANGSYPLKRGLMENFCYQSNHTHLKHGNRLSHIETKKMNLFDQLNNSIQSQMIEQPTFYIPKLVDEDYGVELQDKLIPECNMSLTTLDFKIELRCDVDLAYRLMPCDFDKHLNFLERLAHGGHTGKFLYLDCEDADWLVRAKFASETYNNLYLGNVITAISALSQNPESHAKRLLGRKVFLAGINTDASKEVFTISFDDPRRCFIVRPTYLHEYDAFDYFGLLALEI